jgi:hypothetical protein
LIQTQTRVSPSPDNAQGEIRNEVEDENGQFEKHDSSVMDGVKRIDRHFEPLAVEPVHKIMRERNEQPPPEQQPDVDQRTPTQHVANRF